MEFSEPTVDDLLTAFKSSESSGSSYARTQLLRAALEYLMEADDPRSTTTRYDLLLFDLRPSIQGGARFLPLMPSGEGNNVTQPYPDIDKEFPSEALDYYGERAASADVNDAQCAIYNDFLWVREWDGRPPIEQARGAIAAYLRVCPAAQARGEWGLALDAACRAVDLSASLQQEEHIRCSLDQWSTLMAALETGNEQLRFRWMVQGVKAFLGAWKPLRRYTDPEMLRGLIDRTILVLATLNANGGGMEEMRRSFLKLREQLGARLQDAAWVSESRLLFAESYVEEAEFLLTHYEDGAMAAADAYAEAVRLFSVLGGHGGRVEVLKTKLRECNAAARKQYVHDVTEVEFPRELVEVMAAAYTNLPLVEAIRRLAVDQFLIPTFEDAETDAAAKVAQLTGMDELVATTITTGDSVLATYQSAEERLQYYTVSAMLRRTFMISEFFLNPIFDVLTIDSDSFTAAVESILEESPRFSPERSKLVLSGVSNLLRRDTIAAVHIFVFQLERVLRDLLFSMGAEVFSLRGERMRQLELDTILNRLEDRGVSKDLLRLTRYLLHDVAGPNLRNEVAHGIAGLGDFSRTNANILLHLLLRIALVTPALEPGQ